MSGPRYNFPRWTYGYTLGPPTASNGGNYTQMYIPAAAPAAQNPAVVQLGGLLTPGGGPQIVAPAPRQPIQGNRGGKSGSKGGAASKSDPKPTPASSNEPPKEAKKDSSLPEATPEGPKEEGEIIERPLNEILRGRNPIMFCNDQSKLRNLHMEWEQVSETGPPHDKTFTWSLKMGEMMTMGSANSKKSAKNKAAEEMAKKLDHTKDERQKTLQPGFWTPVYDAGRWSRSG